MRGHSDDAGNDRADELVQWGEMAGPHCRLPLDKEGEQETLQRRKRVQPRLTEEENKKTQPKKNNKNNTITAAKDIRTSQSAWGTHELPSLTPTLIAPTVVHNI